MFWSFQLEYNSVIEARLDVTSYDVYSSWRYGSQPVTHYLNFAVACHWRHGFGTFMFTIMTADIFTKMASIECQRRGFAQTLSPLAVWGCVLRRMAESTIRLNRYSNCSILVLLCERSFHDVLMDHSSYTTHCLVLLVQVWQILDVRCVAQKYKGSSACSSLPQYSSTRNQCILLVSSSCSRKSA